MGQNKDLLPQRLVDSIRQVLEQARRSMQCAVNAGMVQGYWHVGRLIVEQEQQGAERAEYGKQQLEQLAQHLQTEFGKGFDARNLRHTRAFYQFGTQCVPN